MLSHPLRILDRVASETTSTRPSEDSREALQLIVGPDESRFWTALVPLTAIARVALTRETIPAAQAFCGAQSTPRPSDRPVGSGSAGAQDARGLSSTESLREFLASVDIGRQLDLWDAVGSRSARLELPQTEP